MPFLSILACFRVKQLVVALKRHPEHLEHGLKLLVYSKYYCILWRTTHRLLPKAAMVTLGLLDIQAKGPYQQVLRACAIKARRSITMFATHAPVLAQVLDLHSTSRSTQGKIKLGHV